MGYRYDSKGQLSSITNSSDSTASRDSPSDASRETGTISPATNERAVLVLHKSDFARGPYTFKGVFKSFRAGGFVINGITAAFLAPVVGEAADPST